MNARSRIVLLTGMSGVGKSSVIAALRALGHHCIDMDEPGWSYVDALGHQLWHTARLHAAIDDAWTRRLFIAGCSESQASFYAQCKHVILLSAPWPVMVQRIRARTDNRYGKTVAQLHEIRRNFDEIEPLLRARATHEITTDRPLPAVVDAVLDLVH